MKALAVDVGGSHATCALVDDRTLIATETVEAEGARGLRALLPEIESAMKRILDSTDTTTADCEGLAFSFCGLVDCDRGRILSTNAKYDDGSQMDLPSWSRAAFSLPLRIENDARLALLGEWYAGAARGFNDVVMVTLGTGIGGAAMLRGRLLRGNHYQAGCLGGHLPVAFQGRKCTCGAIGCAEAEASSVALPAICREAPGFSSSKLASEARITYEALFRHAAAGDQVACEIRHRSLSVWGAAVVALIHAYDPDTVVLGGGIMRSAGAILPFMQRYVHEHAWTPWGNVDVRSAALGNQAALLGAIPLLTGEEM